MSRFHPPKLVALAALALLPAACREEAPAPVPKTQEELDDFNQR